jgi:hypothetical protein
LLLIGLLADRTLFLSRCGVVKSPEALRENAQELLRDAGYDTSARWIMTGLALDTDCLQYVRSQADHRAAWQKVASGEFPAVYFWYRQGDSRLPHPRLFGSGELAPSPPVSPGAALVRLSGSGRLLTLQVGGEHKSTLPTESNVNWAKVFQRTGLSWPEYHEVKITRWPPLFADEVHQWERAAATGARSSPTVLAAAREGRVVYTEVVQPWESARASPAFAQTQKQQSRFVALRTALWLAAFAAACYLAWRHIRHGQADWRGAWSVSATLMALTGVAWLCGSRHSFDVTEEVAAAVKWLNVVVFSGVVGGVAYLAVEPSVRRGWPWSIATLQRLLDGRLTDRGIWTDVLVGAVLGLAAVLLRQFGTLLNQALNVPVSGLNDFDPGQNLLDHFGLRYKFAVLVDALLGALLESLLLLAVILAIKRLVRSTKVAAVVAVVVMTSVSILGRDLASPIDGLARVGLLGIAAWLVVRFGLLTGASALATYYAVNNSPITLERSAWYATTGLTVVLLIITALIVSWRFARASNAGAPLAAAREISLLPR